MLVNSDQMAME